MNAAAPRLALAFALAGAGVAAADGTPPSGTSPATPVAQPTPPPPPAVLTTPAAEAAAADTTKKLSFAQAIRLAEEHAADARIADDEVARAYGLLKEAAAALRPLVGVSAGYQQLEGNRTVAGRETESGESFLGQLTVSMPLMNFRERADRQRAEDQLAITRAAAATTRRAVAIAAGKAYLSVFAATRIIEVAELARETAEAHVVFAQQRHSGGIGTELDIVRAQAELATDESQLASAQTAKTRAEEALGVLTGQSEPLASNDEPDLGDVADPKAVASRADILGGKLRLDSAAWSRKAQWAEWVPTLSLTGAGFYDAPQIDPLPALGFTVLVNLAMPLYDGGFRDGLKRERDAVLAEAREELAQIDRTATSEVRVGIDAVKRAHESRDAAHKAADLAQKALDLANIAYSGGTGTGLDVIDAQRSAREAAAQAVIADDDLRQAQLDLQAASGRFP